MFFIFILFYFPIISKLKNNNFFGKYYLLLEKNVQKALRTNLIKKMNYFLFLFIDLLTYLIQNQNKNKTKGGNYFYTLKNCIHFSKHEILIFWSNKHLKNPKVSEKNLHRFPAYIFRNNIIKLFEIHWIYIYHDVHCKEFSRKQI